MKTTRSARMCMFVASSLLFASSLFAQDNESIELNKPMRGAKPFMMKMESDTPNRPMVPFIFQDPVVLQTILKDIGVSDATIEKIITITRDYAKILQENMIRLQREELNIKEELLKDNPDLRTLQGIINKKTQIFGEVEFTQIKRDLEIKGHLTGEEYGKVKAAVMDRMHRMAPMLRDNIRDDKSGRKK